MGYIVRTRELALAPFTARQSILWLTQLLLDQSLLQFALRFGTRKVGSTIRKRLLDIHSHLGG